MTVPSDPMDVTAEVVEEVYNECFKETNNGTDIQPSDNVRGTASDISDLHSESDRTDKRRLDSALPQSVTTPTEDVTRTIGDTDLGASKPVPVSKPEPKRTLEHSIVKACGHSIDLRHPPTQANCEDCWEAFLTLSVDTSALHKILTEQGRSGLERLVGRKFVKAFGKFLRKQLTPPSKAPELDSLEVKTLEELGQNNENIQTQ